jgi:hypothetical protein
MRIEPDRHQAKPVGGQVKAHPIDAVRQQNRNAIADPDILSSERPAEPVNAIADHVPAMIAPRLL